ncbi:MULTISPECIES: DUF4397 domain-containing protein [Clostridium]|uniref:DUF4397 domain-containing protein n=1 Tax=Clostridium TaxID=1485 RepID=UPI000289C771|nr:MULTISPECIES: DUF4397 domain-containing protein [Clostridium]MDF2502664.1 hypothetical protein [Clostridium sp.]
MKNLNSEKLSTDLKHETSSDYNIEKDYRETQSNSYIRFLNASSNSPAVDIYSNNTLLVQNLPYKEFSLYFPASSGNYNIRIYPTGQNINPILDADIHIAPNTITNLAITGNTPNLSLYAIPEPVAAQNFGRPCIRFVHLSPDAPAVDLNLSIGTKVFSNVTYKKITDYACLPAGTYTFNINATGSDNTALTIPNVQLLPNTYYTIYALGSVEASVPLSAVVTAEQRQ